MTKETLETGIALLDQIKQMEDIILQVESYRIHEVVLRNGSAINYIPRGDIKDAILKNCREKIEECNLRIAEL